MELRLLGIAARVLDPRRWRARLAQLAAIVGTLGFVWVRSVRSSEELDMVRDARRAERRDRVRSRRVEREQQRWESTTLDL